MDVFFMFITIMTIAVISFLMPDFKSEKYPIFMSLARGFLIGCLSGLLVCVVVDLLRMRELFFSDIKTVFFFTMFSGVCTAVMHLFEPEPAPKKGETKEH